MSLCWLGLHAWPTHLRDYQHGEDRWCRRCMKHEMWLGWPARHWATLPRWD